MTGYLTTHVLDTARGEPAAGLRIELHRIEGATRAKLAEAVTNDDGRTDDPVLPADRFAAGTYELTFHVAEYLDRSGADAGFLDVIPLRFRMTDASHYHVPLLLSPFGYSTYRGS